MNNYPYIRAWQKFMGAKPYYINQQVALAQKEHAPADAIYRHTEGRWQTMSESPMTDDVRHQIETYAQSHKK